MGKDIFKVAILTSSGRVIREVLAMGWNLESAENAVIDIMDDFDPPLEPGPDIFFSTEPLEFEEDIHEIYASKTPFLEPHERSTHA